MKARRLAALAALVDIRTQRQRHLLERALEDLRRTERQRHELSEHAHRYQREPVARAQAIAPPLLLQRREFVTRLTDRIALLGEQIRQGERRVRDARERHATAIARGMALDALRQRAAADEALAAARDEQRRTDAVPSGCTKRGFDPARAGELRRAP